MPFRVTLFQEIDKLEPEVKSVILAIIAEIERSQEETVTRRDFSEFVQKTEDNFQRVWQAIDALTEAQARTEQRVEELAQAQARTEQRVEELAQAQTRTEQRVESLAQTVEKLTETVGKLAEQVQVLSHRIDDISVQLGGISNTIGYSLEDQSYSRLKRIVKRDFGVDVDRLVRKNIVYAHDRFDEVNIYGEGEKNGNAVYVIGECKAQFGPNDVNKYITMLERVKEHLDGEIIPLTLSYSYHPEAENRLQTQGIRYYWSYELAE